MHSAGLAKVEHCCRILQVRWDTPVLIKLTNIYLIKYYIGQRKLQFYITFIDKHNTLHI